MQSALRGIDGLIPGHRDPNVADDTTITTSGGNTMNAKKGEYIIPDWAVARLGTKFFDSTVSKVAKEMGIDWTPGPKSHSQTDSLGRSDAPDLPPALPGMADGREKKSFWEAMTQGQGLADPDVSLPDSGSIMNYNGAFREPSDYGYTPQGTPLGWQGVNMTQEDFQRKAIADNDKYASSSNSAPATPNANAASNSTPVTQAAPTAQKKAASSTGTGTRKKPALDTSENPKTFLVPDIGDDALKLPDGQQYIDAINPDANSYTNNGSGIKLNTNKSENISVQKPEELSRYWNKDDHKKALMIQNAQNLENDRVNRIYLNTGKEVPARKVTDIMYVDGKPYADFREKAPIQIMNGDESTWTYGNGLNTRLSPAIASPNTKEGKALITMDNLARFNKDPEKVFGQQAENTYKDRHGSAALVTADAHMASANNDSRRVKNEIADKEVNNRAYGRELAILEKHYAPLLSSPVKAISDKANSDYQREKRELQRRYRVIDAASAGTVDPTSFDSSPRRAKGGALGNSKPYLVGEEGPELFVPEQNGTIIPNPKTIDQHPQEVLARLKKAAPVHARRALGGPVLTPAGDNGTNFNGLSITDANTLWSNLSGPARAVLNKYGLGPTPNPVRPPIQTARG